MVDQGDNRNNRRPSYERRPGPYQQDGRGGRPPEGRPGGRPTNRPDRRSPGGERPLPGNRPRVRPGDSGYRPGSQAGQQEAFRPPAGGRPALDPEAARRAARSSMYSRPDSYSYRDSYTQTSIYDREGYEEVPSNDYMDALFEDSEEEEGLPKPVKIAIAVIIALVVIIAFFLVIRTLGKKGSDTRLERRTEEKRGPVETTEEVTTAPRVTKSTEAEETLPPLGTDPYHNPPAWIPPTQAPTEEMTTSPPPVVVQLPPAVVETTLVTSPPPITETPAETSWYIEETAAGPTSPPPLDPAASGDSGETAGPTSPPPIGSEGGAGQSSLAGESSEINLPAPAVWEDVRLPDPVSGTIIEGASSFWFLRQDAGGQYQLTKGEGSYAEIYSSPDNQHIIARTEDGRYLLFDSLNDGTLLQSAPSQGLQNLVGNEGFAYISSGQLYYCDFATMTLRVLSPDVSSAMIAADSNQFLVMRGGEIGLLDVNGNFTGLLEAYSPTQLNYFDDVGRIAIFQDDMNVYAFNPMLYGPQALRLGKVLPGQRAKIQVTPEGNELVIYQEQANSITRVTRTGVEQRISNPNLVIDQYSHVLGAGPDSLGAYSSLVIYSQGNLYLSNQNSLNDGVNFQATQIASGVKEYVTSGNSIFFVDNEKNLMMISSSADLQSAEIPISILSYGGVQQVNATMDGSGVLYLKDGALWRRSTSGMAEKISDGVKSYLMNPDASQIYFVSADNALYKYSGGISAQLAAPGSVDDNSFSINPTSVRGGNVWLNTPRLAWLGTDNLIYLE